MTEFSTIPSQQIRCHYFPLCSGCEIQDGVITPPIFNDVKKFFKTIASSLNIPLFYQEITQWRIRSKLAVRGEALNPEIGLFKKGSHDVVSIPDCPLHHPAINTAYALLRQKIIELKLPLYQEEKLTGILRYVQFVVERQSGRIQLTLVINRKERDPLVNRLAKLLAQDKIFLGVWINYQPESTNLIFGQKWELVAGEPHTWEKLGGVSFAFHPACFAQAHLSLFEKILESIQQTVMKQRNVIEFYAGIGVIGLTLAGMSEKVICSEINPYSEECFHLSRLRLSPDIQRRVSFVLGKAEETAYLVDQADVLIVDPPRKGLDPLLLSKILNASHLQQIVYLSCGFQSFQRDCQKLVEAGWCVEKAEAYLLFPGTNHVETLCILKKSG